MGNLKKDSLKKAILICFLHVFFASVFIWGYLEETSPQMSAKYERHRFFGHKTYGGRLKYGTFINLLFFIIYFSLSTLNSFYELLRLLFDNGKSLERIQANNNLRRLCNFIYTSFVFGGGAFVTTKFWFLYAIDREMIFSRELAKVVTPLQNHIFHTCPLIAVLIDSYFNRHIYHRRFIPGVIPSLLYSLGIVAWILIVYNNAGFWVYPFLGDMPLPQRTAFITVTTLYTSLLYKLGQVYTRYVWSPKKSAVKRN